MAQPQEEGRRRPNAQFRKPVETKAGTAADIAAKLRADADDPDEVRKALDDAAGMSRNLWLVFLTFGTYLAIAVGSVTHRNLFLEDPIKLPLLNVELPLVAFFWVAPLLFLIFHAYLLLNLRLLVDNVRRYNEVVDAAKLDPKQDDSFRLLLTNFPFVQLLAGTSDSRSGLVGGVLRGIVWITVVLAPVMLLVLMQLQFLPYHDWRVTTVHRAVIVADLILLWLFWPTIMDNVRGAGLANRLIYGSGAVLTGLVIIFAVHVATFPGESLDRNVVAMTPWPLDWELQEVDSDEGENSTTSRQLVWIGRPIYQLLFLGDVDEVSSGRTSLWSNTLVLPDQDFIEDDETLDKTKRTVSLRGRDLQGAVLIRTDLRQADFTGANLNEAKLDRAKLEEAQFGCAKRGNDDDDRSSGCTTLQGASLRDARLQLASLVEVEAQGADLFRAHLEMADLSGAQLQGARLTRAWLQGASLEGADLQGAVLREAQLQGASIDRADFTGASLMHSIVWRSNYGYIFTDISDMTDLVFDKKYFPEYERPGGKLPERRLDDYALDDMISVTTRDTRENLAKSLRATLTKLRDADDDDHVRANLWIDIQRSQSTGEMYRNDLAFFIVKMACGDLSAGNSEKGRLFATRGLIRNARIQKTGCYSRAVEDRLLQPETCAGSLGLSAEDKRSLSRAVFYSIPAVQLNFSWLLSRNPSQIGLCCMRAPNSDFE